jgi:hypothetical protein
MDKRNKAEQFRKSRKNFFQRAYKIGIKSDVEMFILMKRKGKLYTFTNTDHSFWPSQVEIVGKWVDKIASQSDGSRIVVKL